MINLNLYSSLIDQNRGLLSDIIKNPAQTNNFFIRKYPIADRWVLLNNNSFWDSNTTIYSDDHISYLTQFMPELLNRDFNSILIAGLGLGIIPYIVKDVCSIVDVVEKEQELISLIQPLGYLPGVNIINADIFTFTPTQTYDIIILDIWTCHCEEDFGIQAEELIERFLPYLNTGGFVYVPMYTKTWFTPVMYSNP